MGLNPPYGCSQHPQSAYIPASSYWQPDFTSPTAASCHLVAFELCPWGGVLRANSWGAMPMWKKAQYLCLADFLPGGEPVKNPCPPWPPGPCVFRGKARVYMVWFGCPCFIPQPGKVQRPGKFAHAHTRPAILHLCGGEMDSLGCPNIGGADLFFKLMMRNNLQTFLL